MIDLGAGDERFRDDHGEADPAVSAALAAYAARTGGELAVLGSLAGSRLLVPVVAVLGDGPGAQSTDRAAHGAGLNQGEKASEMAMPVIVARDGRRALPAFTSAGTLRLWQPAGRPVPAAAAAVWRSAVQESCAVVIDIAGPVSIVVEGSRLAALAAGNQSPAMHDDPDVWQLAAATAAEFAPGIRVRLSAPEDGLDLTLELAPPQGAAHAVPAEAARQIGDAVAERLAERVRTGIAVLVRPPGDPAPTGPASPPDAATRRN